MKKHVLVTGANGFIGQHLCRFLIDNDFHVRGLCHEQRELYFIKKNEIDWVQADLTDANSLKNIADGMDYIFHLAAIPRNDLSKQWNDFFECNVKGTERLLAEAEKSHVKRFVFISTVEAAGYGDGINPRTESDIAKPDNNYGKSKLEAEKIVMSDSWSFDRTIFRLPMIYGPGTFIIVPKLFGMICKGFYPFIGSGATLMEFCYVGNAVAAIVHSIESDKAKNQLYYISDQRTYTIKEVIDAIARSLNKKYFPLFIPKLAAYAAALIFELLARIAPFPPIVSKYSKKPFFTRETVRWTTSNINFVSTEKFKRDLMFFPPFTIDQGCSETVLWLRAHGFEK